MVLSSAMFGCSDPTPSPLTLVRLGESDATPLRGAPAAVLTLDGVRDTLLGWEEPVRSWSSRFELRQGDAGTVRTEDGDLAFTVERVWSEQEWLGPVWESVQRGRWSDSLWLAGRYGKSAMRLSLGSGCWALRVDSTAAQPVATGESLQVEWAHGAATPTENRSETPPSPFSMNVRWGDDDQLLPAFWRAITRWGAPAEWELVCPCQEAFGRSGIPASGLPPFTPVHFRARIRPASADEEQAGAFIE